jgi:hypothetical protein
VQCSFYSVRGEKNPLSMKEYTQAVEILKIRESTLRYGDGVTEAKPKTCRTTSFIFHHIKMSAVK